MTLDEAGRLVDRLAWRLADAPYNGLYGAQRHGMIDSILYGGWRPETEEDIWQWMAGTGVKALGRRRQPEDEEIESVGGPLFSPP